MELSHVLNRGVDKREIFLDKQDYLRFIHDLYELNDRKNVCNAGLPFKGCDVENYLINDIELEGNSLKHLEWANSFKHKVNKNNVKQVIEQEVVNKFANILEDCGIFKQNENELNEFKKFVDEVVL